MAGTRKTPVEPEVLEDVPEFDDGSDASEQLPVDQMNEKWQSLFKRAVARGCTEKAARLYADSHERDGEEDK